MENILLEEIEKEILLKAYNNGDIKDIHVTVDQIKGEFVVIGSHSFLRKGDVVFHLRYRDALDKLVSREYVKFESGILYRLTISGINAAKYILSTSKDNKIKKEIFFKKLKSFLYDKWTIAIGTVILAIVANLIFKPFEKSENKLMQYNKNGDNVFAINSTVNIDKRIQNIPKGDNSSINKHKTVKTEIKRLIEDATSWIENIINEDNKNKDYIRNTVNLRSGGYFQAQIERVNKFIKEIKDYKRNMDRKIEDLLSKVNENKLEKVKWLSEENIKYNDLIKYFNKVIEDVKEENNRHCQNIDSDNFDKALKQIPYIE